VVEGRNLNHIFSEIPYDVLTNTEYFILGSQVVVILQEFLLIYIHSIKEIGHALGCIQPVLCFLENFYMLLLPKK
jgi:hypothetical protein